jgi:hypothetical protein
MKDKLSTDRPISSPNGEINPTEKASQPQRPDNLREVPRPKLDPSQFKRTEDTESGFLDEGVELTISLVKSPPQGIYVRVHPSPDYQWTVSLLESKLTKELFLAMPPVEAEFRGDKFLGRYYLFYGVTEHGKHFGWALKMSGTSSYAYTESGRNAATAASKTWCRIDIENFKYKVRPADSATDFPEPSFSDASPEDVLNAIFDCLIAYDLEHPAVKQLKGQK